MLTRWPADDAALAAARGEIAALASRGDSLRQRAGNCEVVWRRFGAGPHLVLLHGGYGSWLHWVRNVDVLAARFTLWAPDLPAFHESGDLPACRSHAERFDLLVATLIESWSALVGATTPVSVAGFSFGAVVAGAWANASRAVERLVLLGPSGHGTARRPIAPLNSWTTMLVDAERRASIAENLRLHMLHDARNADVLAYLLHEEACLAARFRSRPISATDRLMRDLGAIRQPVLFIWGAHDVTAHPAALAEQVCAGHAERSARIVADAGHWVQYERAEEVNASMLDWLSRDGVHGRAPG